MLKKLAIGLSLSMVAVGSMAAENGDVSTSVGAETTQTSGALADRFKQLDSNSDGTLSRIEAEADSSVSRLYDSLDTSPTIEDSARNAKSGGITLDQFESGMQAEQRGGTVGPAVSGGETYKVYPDGSRERVDGTAADTEMHTSDMQSQ